MKKMSITLATVFTLTLASLLANAGGDVGNGGGIAEQNFEYAMQNLEGFYDACLAADTCQLTSEERRLLVTIRNSLAVERRSPAPLLRFTTEGAQPGTFVIDGQHRVAVTGNQIQSPIIINTDLIYSRDHTGATVPLSVPAAVGVLTHELAHHHNVENHQSLDVLGAKVRTFIQSLTATITWQNISLTTLNVGSYTQLLLSEAHQITSWFHSGFTHDLSSIVRTISTCPLPNSELQGVRLSNLSIRQISYGLSGHYSKNLHINGFVELSCLTENGPQTVTGLDVNFIIPFYVAVPSSTLFFANPESPIQAIIDTSHALSIRVEGNIEGRPFNSHAVIREGDALNINNNETIIVGSFSLNHSFLSAQIQLFTNLPDGARPLYLGTFTGAVGRCENNYWLELMPNEGQSTAANFRVQVGRL